ncbi:hypothetical protein [Rubrimonas cliftonensis]|uniref:Uncharacterized protein n=1 Tax=Rubrimonas cliftonensis TaxID=89524 RepID=A0A1H4AN59_9RHOB|nr:hypothetical protein [Rubrimonas cliftonensis]SEA37258.1 hypothetical protein SAMN05444370_104297 [Rubrimonas cliftonensis]
MTFHAGAMREETGAPVTGAPSERFALRRDGARPLAFSGARLLSSEMDCDETGARFALELFLTEEGEAIARVGVDPRGETGGAALHVASSVAGPEDLDALIDRLDPAACLPTCLEAGGARAESLAALAAGMRRGYAAFAASLRRAAPAVGPDLDEVRGLDAPLRPAPFANPPAVPGPDNLAAPHGAAPISPPPPISPTATLETERMSQMSPYADRQMPEQTYDAPAPMMGGPEAHAIKRVGAKPLRFHGAELAMSMSFVPGAPCWYEIQLFRTIDQRFVAAVKLFFRDEGEQDVIRAWEFDDFGGLVAHLEAFDPADDVRVDVQPDDPTLSLPEMAAHALALRARAAEARRQYRSLLGEILHDLDVE